MTNGAVTCRVRLDRGGYVPGEAISIWATITNSSRVTIKHTRASLTEVFFPLLIFYKIWGFFRHFGYYFYKTLYFWPFHAIWATITYVYYSIL
jgi:hypothetical protein